MRERASAPPDPDGIATLTRGRGAGRVGRSATEWRTCRRTPRQPSRHPRCRCPARQLGRPLCARIRAPLPAPCAPRPPHRLLAAAAALLVVGRPRRGRPAPALSQPLAADPVRRRRAADARLGLRLQRLRRPRLRRPLGAHRQPAHPVRPGDAGRSPRLRRHLRPRRPPGARPVQRLHHQAGRRLARCWSPSIRF